MISSSPLSNLTRRRRGARTIRHQHATPGIVHTLTQNARQLPSRSTDGTVLDLGTSFDQNGNVAAITDYTATARQTRSMAYDGLDRLTSTTSPMFGSATYAYDTLDNLTRVSVTGGSTPRDHYYCYSASTRRLDFVRSGPICTGAASPAVTTLAYDVQGNLGTKNGTPYTFDYGNRLRGTAGLTYRYDANGRRVRQDSAGAQLKYSYYAKDGRLVWQRDEPGSKRISNLYFAGSLVAEYSRPIGSSTVTISYLHTDALGSPIAKTNASKAVIETSEYEPYGKLLNRANDDRAGYTGHVMDGASGLTYMQQRYYDPAIGRFLSVDPVTAYSNPIGAFNRYRYANNNPYRFTDRDGRCADRYKDGSCKVNVDSSTGKDGIGAGKRLEAVLNKYDKAINRLDDGKKFSVVGKYKMGSIGSMTGKEIKAIWNSQHVSVVPNASIPKNGGAGGYTLPGETKLSPGAVKDYAAHSAGVESLIFHEFSHPTAAGMEAESGNLGNTSGAGFEEREQKVHTIGSVMAGSAGSPFNCDTSKFGCY